MGSNTDIKSISLSKQSAARVEQLPRGRFSKMVDEWIKTELPPLLEEYASDIVRLNQELLDLQSAYERNRAKLAEQIDKVREKQEAHQQMLSAFPTPEIEFFMETAKIVQADHDKIIPRLNLYNALFNRALYVSDFQYKLAEFRRLYAEDPKAFDTVVEKSRYERMMRERLGEEFLN